MNIFVISPVVMCENNLYKPILQNELKKTSFHWYVNKALYPTYLEMNWSSYISEDERALPLDEKIEIMEEFFLSMAKQELHSDKDLEKDIYNLVTIATNNSASFTTEWIQNQDEMDSFEEFFGLIEEGDLLEILKDIKFGSEELTLTDAILVGALPILSKLANIGVFADEEE